MPLSLPVELIPEKNKLDSSGLFLELIEIVLSEAGITLRLVNNNEDVTWNSLLWSRSQIKSGGFTQSNEGGIESVNIQVSNILEHNSKTIQGHIEDATIDNAIGDFVNWYLVNSENLDKGAAISFNFQILNTIAVQEWLTLSLGMKNLFHDRFPLNSYRRNLCRWKVFGGTECRFALSSANTCDRRFITCLGFGHQLRFGGFPGIPKCGGTRINSLGSGTPWIGGGGSGGGGGGFHVTDDVDVVIIAAVANVGGTRAMTSADGIAWSSGTIAAKGWQKVAWGAGAALFVAVANSGTDRVATSTDGSTWTTRTPSADNPWLDVVWSTNLGIFVAVANSGTNRVMTSLNGITWTGRSVPSSTWRGVEWSPGLNIFAAVGSTGPASQRVMTSSDGTSWSFATASSGNGWKALAWSPGLNLFAAVSTNGTGDRVMTSTDGTSWTSRTSAEDNTWNDIAWSPAGSGIFVAVASSGTNRVMTSTNGTSWTTRSVPANTWQSVVWSPVLVLFIAVASFDAGAGEVMTSPDGITWTSQAGISNDNWQGIAVNS